MIKKWTTGRILISGFADQPGTGAQVGTQTAFLHFCLQEDILSLTM